MTEPFALTPPSDIRIDRCRHGLFASIQGDSHIGASLAHYGEWSEGEIELLSQILRPGDVVVDAGANIGAHAVPFARKVGPQGRVFAFEPQPKVFQVLNANAFINGLGQIVPLNAGLGAKHDFASFPDAAPVAGRNFGGVQLAPFIEGSSEAPRQVRVPVGPLDEMLTLDRLRLIKADVEHMELDLIEGAAETIRKHQPVIFLENGNPDETDALTGAMAPFNYRGYWQAGLIFRKENFRGNAENHFGTQGCANILFVPEHFKVDRMTPVDGPDSHPFAAAHKARKEAQKG
ncbi:MAG: FkbM family methyltransferase [Pseudomonadota bacterium]